MSSNVAIVGVGQTDYKYQHTDKSHPELTFEAVSRALDHAGLSNEDLDSVVFGTMDPFDGVNQPDKWEAGSAGAFDAPLMKISTGGGTGLSTAVTAHENIAAGLNDVEIVVAVCTQRAGEATEVQPVLNTAFDPVFQSPLGVDAITQSSLIATRYENKYDVTDEQRAAIVKKSYDNARKNPHAHLQLDVSIEEILESPLITVPFRIHDCPPRSDGSAAVVFAVGDRAREIRDEPVWVTGIEEVTNSIHFGLRPDLSRFDMMSYCARRLYSELGIRDPREYFDVLELYTPFSTREMIHLEALDFAEPGEAKRWAVDGTSHHDGDMPVDPSGGVLASHPIGASGLIRLAEGALQIMGDADERQVADVDTALVSGVGGYQYSQALMSLANDRGTTR